MTSPWDRFGFCLSIFVSSFHLGTVGDPVTRGLPALSALSRHATGPVVKGHFEPPGQVSVADGGLALGEGERHVPWHAGEQLEGAPEVALVLAETGVVGGEEARGEQGLTLKR